MAKVSEVTETAAQQISFKVVDFSTTVIVDFKLDSPIEGETLLTMILVNSVTGDSKA